jgi:hypothetical protein
MNALLPPLLPSAVVQAAWLHLGWSVVLAWLSTAVVRRLGVSAPRWQTGIAAAVAVWCWVPGPLSPAYWLGLAFQAPSTVTVLLCAALLWNAEQRPANHWLPVILPAIACGWLLLLDTLALLPWQIYAWGFSPLASPALLLLASAYWIANGGHRAAGLRTLLVPLALVIFVALRLPSGNAWDAMLDPWLWIVLHGFIIRYWWVRRRGIREIGL